MVPPEAREVRPDWLISSNCVVKPAEQYKGEREHDWDWLNVCVSFDRAPCRLKRINQFVWGFIYVARLNYIERSFWLQTKTEKTGKGGKKIKQ